MIDTHPPKEPRVALEVVHSSAASLRTVRCKLLGFAQLFLNQAEMDVAPKNYDDGSYGIGLILEQLGEEMREISDDLDALNQEHI